MVVVKLAIFQGYQSLVVECEEILPSQNGNDSSVLFYRATEKKKRIFETESLHYQMSEVRQKRNLCTIN